MSIGAARSSRFHLGLMSSQEATVARPPVLTPFRERRRYALAFRLLMWVCPGTQNLARVHRRHRRRRCFKPRGWRHWRDPSYLACVVAGSRHQAAWPIGARRSKALSRVMLLLLSSAAVRCVPTCCASHSGTTKNQAESVGQ